MDGGQEEWNGLNKVGDDEITYDTRHDLRKKVYSKTFDFNPTLSRSNSIREVFFKLTSGGD